ncbi:MAG: GGDEF domain-containing protein [Planctomycetota bacterium]
MFLLEWLKQRALWVRFLIKISMLALIGYLDYVTGDEIGLSILYLAPVAIAAWTDGKYVGGLMAIVSGFVWFLAEIAAGHHFPGPWTPYWNMLIRIGFYWIISTLLARLNRSIMAERQLARVDHLTELWNVRYFSELAAIEASRCRRTSCPFSIAYCDIDDFKKVNDTFGHAAGDALLRDVGAVIKRELRAYDVHGRLGGDEFAILLPDSDYEQASATLKRIKESLERMTVEKGYSVTFSVGAVTFKTPLESIKEMIRRADDLMYQVKRSGKSAILHELEPA